MRTRMAVGLAAAFTAGMALVPMSAKATCTQTIYAERAASDGTTTQLLGRNENQVGYPVGEFEFFWHANTTNAQLANLIFSAVSQRNLVEVTGSAASCPATGTSRAMGNITLIVQQP
jgi:hypothetical protein